MTEKKAKTAKPKKLKTFEVTGTVQLGAKTNPFTKTLQAYNQNHAIEKTMTLFGSKNKAKRRQIQVKTTKEVQAQ